MTPLERAMSAAERQLYKHLRGITRPTNGETFPIVLEGAQDMRELVRAILTAIREPSEAVIAAMRETLPAVYPAEFQEAINVDGMEVENAPKRHWQAMIDAVLEER